ncbi:MAG TPA: GreA/GreB family elongation factor [Thermoanaerobaculia bacterium]|nr:GreA/GreB family elongation factor [Thermoanaerobaculia bacterium]
MTSGTGELPPEISRLVEQRKLDELETLFTNRADESPGDLPFFFALAAAVKKKGSGGKAVAWLKLLADAEAAAGDLPNRTRVLLEIARMSPTDAAVRSDLAATLKQRFGAHPAYTAVAAQFPVDKAREPAEVAGKIERWLRFRVGDIYAMAGRGAGRIAEMNPALDVIRLEVAGTRVPLSLVTAEKNLTLLPEGHFLRRKVEAPASLRALSESDASETVRQLLASFGRSLTVLEIRDHLSGIVDDARWSAFWAAARKHPQLVVSGAGKAAAASWSESAGAAEDAVRSEFEKAGALQKIEIAKKNARRARELGPFFAAGLAAEARKARTARPGLAWELSQAAAKLAPGEPEAFPAEELVSAKDPAAILDDIRDQTARQAALAAIQGGRADWADIFAARIPEEDDGRVLGMLFEALGDRSADLSRRILRSPKTAPRAFIFLAERLHAEGRAEQPALFFALLDALRQNEFSVLRARVKEFFDPGNLAVALVRAAPSEGEARDMLHALERAGGLEDHRRAVVKEALLMKFPELRAPAREYLYATPESVAARREELVKLKQVELPANAAQMKAAKEHGDLSENFEYHAARQRHEYLSARIATLADELSRTRILDPAQVDASEVRVGTRVVLRAPGDGKEREVTILGPWDSKPEDAIYSYQSEFAQSLLGAKAGERVRLPEGEAEVVRIAPWK